MPKLQAAGQAQKLTAYLPLQTAIDFLETKKVALVAKTIKHSGKYQLRREEEDIFHLKALSLLLQGDFPYSIGEMVFLIHSCPIEPADSQDGTMIVRQVISAFPGEAIEIEGAFDREYVCSELSFPIKESFHLSYKVNQTGFPHPSQQTAFTWGEGLLSLLADSQASAELFYKKEQLAKQLLPTGKWHCKAKAHLEARFKLFQERDPLFSLLKKLAFAFFFDVPRECIDEYFEGLYKEPRRFYELSCVHYEVCQALGGIEEEEAEAILERFSQDTCCGRYQKAIGRSLARTNGKLFHFLVSKQRGYEPPPISDLEKRALISIFGECFAFYEELETVPEGISLDLFEEYLTEQIEEKVALFEGLSLSQDYMHKAKQLADECF